MLKLRILLLSDYLYYSLLLIVSIYVLININNTFKSKYDINDKSIIGYIDEIKVDNLNLKIVIIGKEKILGSYYFKNVEEKNEFIKKYKLGDCIILKGTLRNPNNNTVPNLFNYRQYLLSKKIYYLIDITNIEFIRVNHNPFYSLKNKIIYHIDQITLSSSYIKAFLLGDINDITQEVKTSYQSNGISHLFAISGAQISLLALFFLNVFKRIKIKEKWRYAITIFILFIYMFLTNFSPSVLRATIFFVLLATNEIYYLHIKTINLLIVTFVITLISNVYIIYNVGFWYSFIISFFLILFSNQINDKSGPFKKLIMVSYIAFLASLPISLYSFYEINYLSILYNLFFVPFVSFILYPLSLITFIFPFLDKFLYLLIYLMEKLSLFLTNINTLLIFKKLPFYFILIYYLLIILALKKNKYLYLILLIIFHYKYNTFFKEDCLIIIDVGQGDSILIISNNHVALIDVGGKKDYFNNEPKYFISNNITIPLIRSLGYKRVDYLFLTHGDDDHMGEAINLVENFKVENVIFNVGDYNDLENELIEALNEKNIDYYQCLKELSIGDYKLQFLNTGEYDNENDNSSVIYLNVNNYKFLFMGDAGVEREEDILEKYNLTNIDFLKVGHHGSNTSSGEKFINSINPKYSLISVGMNNRYGHPKKSVLDTLSNSKIYRTDKDGSIEIKLNKNGYKIRTCSP